MILPLQQHPHYRQALRRIGATVTTADIPGAAPVQVIKRFGIVFAPRGPIWIAPPDAHALRAAHLRLINSNGGDAQTLQKAGYRQIMTPATVAELALSTDQDVMAAQMHGKWRNIWRGAQKQPFNIKSTPFDTLVHQWLLDADLVQQREKRFRALPHGLMQAYADIAPGDVTVWTAARGNTPIAAMVFLRHGGCATYHLGWTNAVGRQSRAHHRLLIEASMSLARGGVRQLDLGMIDTHNAPGLARFKLGCGATARQLGGSWLKIF
ncbi:GNAT family N-acetyltransferase [Loktanella sp. D2R18]|uniref:GNAT family N-acetyltransferase n=1 Tax=Rhodobacterales TaxID=204455 RepID=UPI000DEAB423|nr:MULTISPECIES: GNAT family N-acetyltransferase [Rhodobacterales]MDO6590668.1 GNAT family N-acetyltransferase [Yoonia sp. 1_MG-2023]RBW44706.1 GNAT family N-acetyltransferase [Loktanella sp. D2R18]